MALQDILRLSDDSRKIGFSEERINAIVPVMRQYIGYFREYPDMFVDFMQTGWNDTRYEDRKLKLFFYQRVFLRATMRYKYCYFVFTRAFSKSFLSILALMIRCILYPGAKLFITSGSKEQSAGIAEEKVEEICNLIPAFRREIDWRRGKTQQGKDYCKYIFKNGSYLDNIVARESSRGKRRHSGFIDECASMDGEILNGVIIPTMNIDRPCADGKARSDEVLNKAQLYMTTAGYKNTFAYDKLIQTLIRMVIEPDKAFIMGGTYRIPVAVGLISKNFVEDLKQDGTFNEATFDREYNSMWSGTVEGAFFDGDWFDRNRKIQLPELEYSNKISTGGYYMLSVDVGRRGDLTVISVLKVTPQNQGTSLKQLVNIKVLEKMRFKEQAIIIKQMYFKYKARIIVIDGNGVGAGLVDDLTDITVSLETGEEYPPFGVANDEDGEFKKYKTPDTIDDAVYIIKANAPINTEMHANLQNQLRMGRIKFLIDENVAKGKLLEKQVGKKMTPEQRQERLMPYNLTTVLKQEMLNLVQENDGINIILKQANKSVHKDKVSSLEMGLYWIKLDEDSKRKKKKRRFSDFMFMT